ELFGHRKGAFTGAIDHRKGAFEQADGGTLFLDEIGELPLDMQPVLLRVLESRELRPVGAQESRRVSVRIVAATNLDLEQQVRAGRFREDLYYRLAVVRLRVPPLRERPEDIEPLARRFAQQAGLGDVPASVLDHWKLRDWPGNARQLRNSVQSYAALGAVLDAPLQAPASSDAVPASVDLQRPYADQKQELTDRFTRAYLEGLLKECNGNRTAAARRAGLDRAYLVRLLGKYGLTGDD
ncbi:MAG: sigma-54-dependent Fis family transcriptional regulator, partial [Myxococcales bacterium]